MQLLWQAHDLGTCAGTLRFTLPVSASWDQVSMLNCRNGTTSALNQSYVSVSSNMINIQKYDGTFPAAIGDVGYCTGWLNSN